MRFVDYGCGDGKLADYVQNELSVRGGGTSVSHKLLKYEKYLHPEEIGRASGRERVWYLV